MKKTTEVVKITPSEVATIPSKEELQIGMRKTLKELEDKLSKLTGPPNRQFKIGNYIIREGGFDGSFDPKTSTDLNILIRILAQLRRAEREHSEIVKEFNIKNAPCIIWGLSVETWIDDVTYRIESLTNSKEIVDIKAAKTKLEAFLSEDDRLIKVLSEVEQLLK